GKFSLDESFDVGQDTGTPVIDDYETKMPFKFTGKLEKVEIKLGPDKLTPQQRGPHTLAAASESDGGKQAKITFERVIVWPDGHREIEGVTPKQLPKPDIAHQPQVGENGSNEGDER